MRKPPQPSLLRQRYIDAGLITPDPIRSSPPLSAEELSDRGFHAAAKASRNNPRWSRAR